MIWSESMPDETAVSPEREVGDFGKAFPGVWKLVEAKRIEGAKARLAWPPWCYLPYEHAHEIMRNFVPNLPPEIARTISSPVAQILEARRILAHNLCLYSAWRHTKGIYRFDPSVYAELIDTPLDSELPCELLLRLPEWAVTMETPGLLLGETLKSHVMLTVTLRDSEPIVILTCNLFRPLVLPLARQSIAAALAHAFAAGELRRVFEPFVRRALALAIYLCCEEPDMSSGTDRRAMGMKKTRRGTKFFPPGSVQMWDVGMRIGAELRTARDEWERENAQHDSVEGHQRARPRPHFRKAHERRVWYGSGDNARAVYRWFPSTLVNTKKSADLIETIRPVKANDDDT